jgi:hypothetical protein
MHAHTHTHACTHTHTNTHTHTHTHVHTHTLTHITCSHDSFAHTTHLLTRLTCSHDSLAHTTHLLTRLTCSHDTYTHTHTHTYTQVGLPFACFFSLMASLAMQGIYCVRDQMEDPFVQSISAERISLGGEFHNLCVNHADFTFAFAFWVAVLTRSYEGADLLALKCSSHLSVRLYQACIYANRPASFVTCEFSGNVCCAFPLLAQA